MMPRILRFALMVLMAIASAVFIYGMVQEFNRLPPQSAPANQGNAQPHAITSALSYDRKFIHPECTEENGVRHCEVPSEQANHNAELIVMATRSLSPKQTLERTQRHRQAVMMFARLAAKRAVQDQLRAQGVRVTLVLPAEIM